ncbi:MAG: hypothetical protein HYX68_08225 [Planctomycetes bacterium]|nr:hypothetical protein [Planctomycetota bacterium]
MTLEKTLRQQLNEPGTGGFHVHADGWAVTLVSEKADSLSCALKDLTLDRAEPIGEDLSAWAARVARQVTGLLEPLRVLEVDTPRGTALLRSDAPASRDGKALYYELLLTRTDRTRANLRRYAGDPAGAARREPVAFVLTHDAIVKLVNDLGNVK